MSQHDDLLRLERAAWEALSSSGAAAATFYAEVLAGDVLMLLPGGLVLDDRTQVIDSMRGTPWTSFELSDERVVELTDDCAVVATGRLRVATKAGRCSTAPTCARTARGGWRSTSRRRSDREGRPVSASAQTMTVRTSGMSRKSVS